MPQHQPAPNGWADAYREIMEQIWQGVAEAGDHVLSHADITALAAYAAEIREGIAAGLVRAGTDPTTIRVPLVAVPPLADQPVMCTDEHQPPHRRYTKPLMCATCSEHITATGDPETGRHGPQA